MGFENYAPFFSGLEFFLITIVSTTKPWVMCTKHAIREQGTSCAIVLPVPQFSDIDTESLCTKYRICHACANVWFRRWLEYYAWFEFWIKMKEHLRTSHRRGETTMSRTEWEYWNKNKFDAHERTTLLTWRTRRSDEPNPSTEPTKPDLTSVMREKLRPTN